MDPAETTTQAVGFLMSGPPFEIEVPSSLHPVPQIVSPLDITGSGTGRECAFVPAQLDQGLAPELFDRLDDLEGCDGRWVEAWPRNDGEMWFLRWPLTAGLVYVHIRVEDGFESSAQEIVSNLHIYEDAAGIPTVTPDAPLARMASREQGYMEVITFFETDGDHIEGSVDISRPGSLARGAETVKHSVVNPGKIDLIRGGPGNIDIRVSGALEEDAARQINQAIESSLSRYFS